MGDSSRSVTSICGPCEYITPIGVRVPHNPHHLPSRRALDNYTLILTVNTPSIHFFPTDNNV